MKVNLKRIVQVALLHENMTKRRCSILLVILLCLSIVVRLIFVTCFLDHERYYWEDTIHYYSAAESLVSNGNFGTDPERPAARLRYGLEPVYPLFVAPLLLLFPSGFLGIRVVQSIVITMSSFLFYKIVRIFVNRKLALFGTALYLFYPFYVYFSGVILPEAIYVPALLLYVYLVLMYLLRSKTKYLYSAVALLAVLGHLKVASWSMGLIAILVFFLVNKKLNTKMITEAVICGGIFLILCLPWGVRNYMTYGKVTLPRNYISEAEKQTEFEHEFRRRFSLPENAYYLFSPTLTRILSQNKFNQPLYQYVSIAVVTPLLIATAVLPFFKRNRMVLLLYLMFFSYCLPYLLLRGQTRYRLPIDFIMIFFFVILVSLLPWFTGVRRAPGGPV